MLIKENRKSKKHERDVLAKELSKTSKQIKCLLQNLRHPDQVHFRRSGKKSIFSEEQKIKLMAYNTLLLKENRQLTNHEVDVLSKDMDKTPQHIHKFIKLCKQRVVFDSTKKSNEKSAEKSLNHKVVIDDSNEKSCEIKKYNEQSHSLKDEDVKDVNKSCNPKEENLVKNELHQTIMPEILTNIMNKLKSGEKVKLKTSEIHPGELSQAVRLLPSLCDNESIDINNSNEFSKKYCDGGNFSNLIHHKQIACNNSENLGNLQGKSIQGSSKIGPISEKVTCTPNINVRENPENLEKPREKIILENDKQIQTHFQYNLNKISCLNCDQSFKKLQDLASHLEVHVNCRTTENVKYLMKMKCGFTSKQYEVFIDIITFLQTERMKEKNKSETQVDKNLLKIFHESRVDQIFSPKVNLQEKQYEKVCENGQEINSTNIQLKPGTPLEISNDLSLLPRSKIQESSQNTLVMPFIAQIPYNSTMKMPSESVPKFLDIIELDPVNSTFLQPESQETSPDDYMLKTLKEKFDYNPVLENQTYINNKCDLNEMELLQKPNQIEKLKKTENTSRLLIKKLVKENIESEKRKPVVILSKFPSKKRQRSLSPLIKTSSRNQSFCSDSLPNNSPKSPRKSKKRFINLIELKNGKVRCSLCNLDYSCNISARAHCKRVHADPEYNECNLCKQIFPNRMNFRTHLNLSHGITGSNLVSQHGRLVDINEFKKQKVEKSLEIPRQRSVICDNDMVMLGDQNSLESSKDTKNIKQIEKPNNLQLENSNKALIKKLVKENIIIYKRNPVVVLSKTDSKLPNKKRQRSLSPLVKTNSQNQSKKKQLLNQNSKETSNSILEIKREPSNILNCVNIPILGAEKNQVLIVDASECEKLDRTLGSQNLGILNPDPVPLKITFYKCILCANKYGSSQDVETHLENYHKIGDNIQKSFIEQGCFA